MYMKSYTQLFFFNTYTKYCFFTPSSAAMSSLRRASRPSKLQKQVLSQRAERHVVAIQAAAPVDGDGGVGRVVAERESRVFHFELSPSPRDGPDTKVDVPVLVHVAVEAR